MFAYRALVLCSVGGLSAAVGISIGTGGGAPVFFELADKMFFIGITAEFGDGGDALLIPAAAGTIINHLTITKLGMYNTLTGVILPGSVKVFRVILLRQAFTKVPRELIEAAEIDGASERRILWKIMVPQIMPSVSTVVIFDFIGKWNEFLWPVIVLKDTDKYPLATMLQYLNGSLNYKFGYVAAGTVVSIIPVILVFVLCQRSYIEAVSGAVKG